MDRRLHLLLDAGILEASVAVDPALAAGGHIVVQMLLIVLHLLRIGTADWNGIADAHKTLRCKYLCL